MRGRRVQLGSKAIWKCERAKRKHRVNPQTNQKHRKRTDRQTETETNKQTERLRKKGRMETRGERRETRGMMKRENERGGEGVEVEEKVN